MPGAAAGGTPQEATPHGRYFRCGVERTDQLQAVPPVFPYEREDNGKDSPTTPRSLP